MPPKAVTFRQIVHSQNFFPRPVSTTVHEQTPMPPLELTMAHRNACRPDFTVLERLGIALQFRESIKILHDTHAAYQQVATEYKCSIETVSKCVSKQKKLQAYADQGRGHWRIKDVDEFNDEDNFCRRSCFFCCIFAV